VSSPGNWLELFRPLMLAGFGVCSRRIARVSADFESSCYEASLGFVKTRLDLTSMVLLQFCIDRWLVISAETQ
jgi:hypothetical protein